jgi:hypothetical protein
MAEASKLLREIAATSAARDGWIGDLYREVMRDLVKTLRVRIRRSGCEGLMPAPGGVQDPGH